jgi:SnoaL-like domain
MNITDAAERWARTWERGWSEKNLEAILDLYSDAVVYSSEPFREPYRGLAGVRKYVGQAFAEEDRVRAVFARPIADDRGASIAWWATLVENGEEITLAGTSNLRFDADGRVVEQWDTWNQAAGRVDASGWLFEGRK